MKVAMKVGCPALSAFMAVAACTSAGTGQSPDVEAAAPAPAAAPIYSMAALQFLIGRWEDRSGPEPSFLVFDHGPNGSIIMCEGRGGRAFVGPRRWFTLRDGRVASVEESAQLPHMPGSWPVLSLGVDHIVIAGGSNPVFRRVGERLELSSQRRVPGDVAAQPAVHSRIAEPDAAEFPGCHWKHLR